VTFTSFRIWLIIKFENLMEILKWKSISYRYEFYKKFYWLTVTAYIYIYIFIINYLHQTRVISNWNFFYSIKILNNYLIKDNHWYSCLLIGLENIYVYWGIKKLSKGLRYTIERIFFSNLILKLNVIEEFR